MTDEKLHDREIPGPVTAGSADLPVMRVMALPGTAGGATFAGAPVLRDEAVTRSPVERDDTPPVHDDRPRVQRPAGRPDDEARPR